jgi:hypothetical protein
MLVAGTTKWLFIAAITRDDNFNFQGPSEKFVGPGQIFISGALFFPKDFPDIEKGSKKFSGLANIS